MKHGFTLIELIVVIIIVGILAAVGISQYSKTVEKSRGAELKTVIGTIRQLAYSYRLENGSCAGISSNDVGLGTGKIPDASCAPTHYFRYAVGCSAPPEIEIVGYRCTSGGKSPQGPENCYVDTYENLDTGARHHSSNCSIDYY